METSRPQQVLCTRRLVLRHAHPDDAPFVLELLNDPAFLAHIGDRQVRTLEQAKLYIHQRILASYEQHGCGMWVLEEREEPSALGLCGIVRREGLDHEDLGYALLPEARGRGLASEAARATLHYGFETLGYERLLAIVSPANTVSIRVLEKIGFERRGQCKLPGDDEAVELYEAVRPEHGAPAPPCP